MSLKSKGGHQYPKPPGQYFCEPPPFDWGEMTPPGAKMLKQQPLHDKRSVENSHF